MKIAVAGTGYVGLSMATLLAQHSVVAVDMVGEKEDKVEKINRGENQIVVECMNKVMKSC